MTLRFPSTQAGNEIRAAKADRIAGAASDRLIAEIERQNVADDQTVWPAPEALHLATAVIRRGYLLPETMEHPIIKFECINLAYLFMAWGLAEPSITAIPAGSIRQILSTRIACRVS